MKILYCRVGWMNSYRGNTTEKPLGGGKYNENNIGYEVYNYLGYKGNYYGFVEVGINNSIHVERLCGEKADYAENIMVIWVATNPNGGQYIIGWYENATVYRNLQNIPENVMSIRDLKDYNIYNIYSNNVILIEPQNRTYRVKGMGHINIWYGNPEVDKDVLNYIKNYEYNYTNRIAELEKNLTDIVGAEKEAVVKIRINQDKFRENLIKKYNGKCCLFGVNHIPLLVASHIKPWAKSDSYEKLDTENGLLLCPNHDKLFDSGLISFDSNGNIIISSQLDNHNQLFLNIRNSYKINITNDNAEYFKYHRNNIFIK